mgnify:FL=1
MTFDRFKNILRRSGAADPVSAGDGDAKLNAILDLWRVPDCGELTARIYAAVTADERLRRQVFVFWRYSAVFSAAFMIGGFCFGLYSSHLDRLNTQSYFNTIFDIGY